MKNDNYFFSVNVLLLLIVLIGFSPTFYLRPLSSQEPLPFYLIIHGISCTAWFIVIVIQSYFIKTGRVIQHKIYGKYFSLIAPMIVLSGFAVVMYLIGKYHMQFPPPNSEAYIEGEGIHDVMVSVGGIIQLITFLLFVYVGYRYRSKGIIHKRAMLIASLIICQQALVRLGQFKLFMIGEDPGASGGIYSVVVPFVLLLSLLVYDTIKFKKPKVISIVGLIAYISFILAAFGLTSSGLALKLIESFR